MLTQPLSLTADTLAERISAVLRSAFADQRHAAKQISRRVDADPRAVENWMAGRCAPHAVQLIRLMAQCEAVKAEVDRLVEEARQCAGR